MGNKKTYKKVTSFFLALFLVFNIITLKADASVDASSILNRIKQIVKDNYISTVPEEVYSSGSVDELIDLLGDPYTEYFTTSEYTAFTNGIENKIVGIGIHIEIVPEGVLVVSLIDNAPAMQAGLLPGDIIVEADGNKLAGLNSRETTKLIMGEAGSTVNIKIKRGESNFLDFKIVRKEIKTPTVTGKVLNNHIGYITIESFGNDTTYEFSEVLTKMEGEKVDGYIIDLRDNPGGYMHVALDIAGYFIGEKTTMLIEDKNNVREALNAYKHDFIIKKPSVFLINKNSASASEILAAAIKDHQRAYFIGNNSYGKGVAQSLFEFDDGSAFKTTTLKFLSPLGKVINKVGISPDYETGKYDPIPAAELLLGNSAKPGKYVRVKLSNMSYDININDIKNSDYWLAYRDLLEAADTISAIAKAPTKTILPELQLVQPELVYEKGERVALKLKTPNYGGRVQYRVMLWDDTSKAYKDLWTNGDRYYSKWMPYGNETFTLGLPISNSGNYRFKVFVKRAGVANFKTAIQGMNCDSYLSEIPVLVE